MKLASHRQILPTSDAPARYHDGYAVSVTQPERKEGEVQKRARRKLKGLFGDCVPSANRSLREQSRVDPLLVEQEYGTARLMALSQLRREFNSVMRRRESVVITPWGVYVARLQLSETVEQLNEGVSRRGASAGAISEVIGR